jgi:hypothetical protein
MYTEGTVKGPMRGWEISWLPGIKVEEEIPEMGYSPNF